MILLAVWVMLCSTPSVHGHEPGYGKRQLSFIENKGQWPAPVLFRSEVTGASLFLENDGVSWVKMETGAFDRLLSADELANEEQADLPVKGHAWRVRFVDHNPDLTVHGRDAQSAYHNYFLGNDPSRWTSHVRLFSSVLYKEVWPGIDINYYGHEGHLKYDILIGPGASPQNIKLRYMGVDGLRLDEQGRLVVATSVGDVLEMAPVANFSDGAQEEIACTYLLQDGVLMYQLPSDYDTSRPVTIDPLLVAATYSGSTGTTGAANNGYCATYDDLGNIYTGARNIVAVYPVTPGAFQTTVSGSGGNMALSKFNADGSNLIWASYLGGSAADAPHSMVVNSQGHLCVLGSTNSSDFPVTTNAFDTTYNGGWDMTVTIVNTTGTALLGSTFIGGSGSDGRNHTINVGNIGEEYRGEIITDATDNLLIASSAGSQDFPTTPGAYKTMKGVPQDAVVLALDPTASNLIFSTFLGGSQSDAAMGIRVSGGSVVVCGYTASTDFPIVAGAYESGPSRSRFHCSSSRTTSVPA